MAALDRLALEYRNKRHDDAYLAGQEAAWADVESNYSIPMTIVNQHFGNYLKGVAKQIAVQRKFQNCPMQVKGAAMDSIAKALNPVSLISDTIKAAIPKPG